MDLRKNTARTIGNTVDYSRFLAHVASCSLCFCCTRICLMGKICCSVSGHVLRVVPFMSVHRDDLTRWLAHPRKFHRRYPGMLGHMRGTLSDLDRPRPSPGISKVGAGGREEAAGETMARDICHAWLHSPSLTMGLGVRPVVAFFSLSSFPGTLLSLTKDLLSPLHFFANI